MRAILNGRQREECKVPEVYSSVGPLIGHGIHRITSPHSQALVLFYVRATRSH